MGTCGSTEAKPRHDDIRAPARRKSIVAQDTVAPKRKGGTKISSVAGGQIGFFSNHGWEEKPPSIFATKGPVKPKVNQDRIFITPKINDRDDCWLFACFDGNGPQGEKVAEQAGYELVRVIENAGSMTGVKFTDDAADPQSLLQSAFESINNSVTREAFSEKSGSTATVVYIKGKKVYVANVGDSKAVRGVLNSSGQVQALELTADHKPVGAEKERIIERGGHVLDDNESYGAARVFDHPDPIAQMRALQEWQREQRSKSHGAMGSDRIAGGVVNEFEFDMGETYREREGVESDEMMIPSEPWPGLAVSRCLGHSGVIRIGIIPTPDVSSFEVDDNDRCLIIASDGIWDFIDPNEALEMTLSHHPDADAACRALVETASQRWIEDDPTYRDDISACVIFTPLDAALDRTISHETVSYTSDSLSAIREAAATPGSAASTRPVVQSKPTLATNLVPKAVPGQGTERVDSTTFRETPSEAAATPPATPPPAAKKNMQGNKMISASKSQRRRSVVTNFTG